jgi:hypothetical protein
VNLRLTSAVVVCCAAAGICGHAWAQDHDFLTPNEIDQVREAQEPNERLTLYIQFAKTRIDLLQQYLAKQKTGRSLFIHNTLEDYSKIIEAIDSVSDDALRRKLNIDKGSDGVVNAEKDFLAALNKMQDSHPPDLERYKFVLDQAIDTTTDSRDLCLEDAQHRGAALSAKDAEEKAEREAMMPNAEVSDRKKTADKDEQQKKKVPSLFKPGEKKPDSR